MKDNVPFTNEYLNKKEQLSGVWGEENNMFATSIACSGDEGYHSHNFFEIFYIIDGKIHHILDSSKFKDLNLGDLFIITPGIFHGFKRIENQICTHRDIMISKSVTKDLLNTISPEFYNNLLNKQYIHIIISSEQILQLEQYFVLFKNNDQNNYSEKKSPLQLIIMSYIVGLFMISENHKTKQGYNLVDSIANALKACVYQNRQITDVLKFYNYNRNYLCKLFKESKGQSMTDYINELKMKRACNLLLYSTTPISQIVILLNFSSESYFYKLFKKEYDISPMQYRKNANKSNN